jgi:hypothetical protein
MHRQNIRPNTQNLVRVLLLTPMWALSPIADGWAAESHLGQNGPNLRSASHNR